MQISIGVTKARVAPRYTNLAKQRSVVSLSIPKSFQTKKHGVLLYQILRKEESPGTGQRSLQSLSINHRLPSTLILSSLRGPKAIQRFFCNHFNNNKTRARTTSPRSFRQHTPPPLFPMSNRQSRPSRLKNQRNPDGGQ